MDGVIETVGPRSPATLREISFALVGTPGGTPGGTATESPAQEQRRGQRGEQRRARDPPGDFAGPLLGGEGEVGGAARLVEAGESARALVGYEQRPEQDEHGAGDEVGRVQPQFADGDLT